MCSSASVGAQCQRQTLAQPRVLRVLGRHYEQPPHTSVLESSVSNILWLNGLCLLAFQSEARVRRLGESPATFLVLVQHTYIHMYIEWWWFVWLSVLFCLFVACLSSRNLLQGNSRQFHASPEAANAHETQGASSAGPFIKDTRVSWTAHRLSMSLNSRLLCASCPACPFSVPCSWQCQFNTRLLFAQPKAMRFECSYA